VGPTSPGHRPHAASLRVTADVQTVAAGGPTHLKGSKPVVQVATIDDPAAFARTVFYS
jgi:hypothetical protein